LDQNLPNLVGGILDSCLSKTNTRITESWMVIPVMTILFIRPSFAAVFLEHELHPALFRECRLGNHISIIFSAGFPRLDTSLVARPNLISA
jgi:hypothetical protein